MISNRRLDLLIAATATALVVTMVVVRGPTRHPKAGKTAVAPASLAAVVPLPKVEPSPVAIEQGDVKAVGTQLFVRLTLRNLGRRPLAGALTGTAVFLDAAGKETIVTSFSKPSFKMATLTSKELRFPLPAAGVTLREVRISADDDAGKRLFETSVAKNLAVGAMPASTHSL